MGEQADRLLVAFSNEQQMKNKTWRTAMEEWKELASSSTEKTKIKPEMHPCAMGSPHHPSVDQPRGHCDDKRATRGAKDMPGWACLKAFADCAMLRMWPPLLLL